MTETTAPGRLHLTKHHGLGNDFLVAVVEDPARFDCPVLAKRLCDRRRGVGADGLIVTSFLPAGDGGADASMALHNADGSRAEMSGNGIRCLAQALAMARGTASLELTIATDAGLRRVEVRPHAGDAATVDVRVGMGPVSAGPAWRPGAAARAALDELGVRRGADGAPHHAETADIGNPHLVIEVPDPWRVDVARLGPVLEADFPAGVNVQFIAAAAPAGQLALTVWERGAGVTEACGTGASAAATVAHRWGLVGPEVTVAMPGGTVQVVVGAAGTELIGPATFIAHLEVDHG